MTPLACMTLYALLNAFGRNLAHYTDAKWTPESAAAWALMVMANTGFEIDHPFRPGVLRGL